MVFYNPMTAEVGSKPTLVYPSKSAEKAFDRRDRGCVERHLQGLADLHKGLITPDTEYLLTIAWENSGDRMVDLWIYSKVDSYGFGPLIDQKTFRENVRDNGIGVACGNSVVLLGREEEHRVARGDLKKYLHGERPELPARLRLNENFYLE
ncbi:MAG: hypothetical protein HYW25_00800 [Candidatus Aenigmarchaeota archaeon]|nr:hypothetical protein [Candidatus Aenigmarchaeota archaeon]